MWDLYYNLNNKQMNRRQRSFEDGLWMELTQDIIQLQAFILAVIGSIYAWHTLSNRKRYKIMFILAVEFNLWLWDDIFCSMELVKWITGDIFEWTYFMMAISTDTGYPG
jgi:hypothetical protein